MTPTDKYNFSCIVENVMLKNITYHIKLFNYFIHISIITETTNNLSSFIQDIYNNTGGALTLFASSIVRLLVLFVSVLSSKEFFFQQS